jgi:hypothetical protein
VPVTAAKPQGLNQQVLAGLLGHRSGAAEAAGRGVDEVGLALLERVVAEAQPIEHARTEVLDHHMGGVDQLEHQLAPLGRLEIDGQAALVAVGAKEKPAHAGDVGLGRRPSALVGAAGRLDLDHVGAHVGKVLGRRGSLQIVAEADDSDVIQQHVQRSPGFGGPELGPVNVPHFTKQEPGQGPRRRETRLIKRSG